MIDRRRIGYSQVQPPVKRSVYVVDDCFDLIMGMDNRRFAFVQMLSVLRLATADIEGTCCGLCNYRFVPVCLPSDCEVNLRTETCTQNVHLTHDVGFLPVDLADDSSAHPQTLAQSLLEQTTQLLRELCSPAMESPTAVREVATMRRHVP